MTKTFKIWSVGELMATEFPPIDEIDMALKRYAATHLKRVPAYEIGGEVRIRGEALSEPIIWEGRQWAVTSYGVECRDGTYAIEKSRLWENEEQWGWVKQLSHKIWVDGTDFAEALRIARGYHEQN